MDTDPENPEGKDDFFEPAPEDDAGGEPMTFIPGRPVTVVAPEVPKAKSSVPYVTIGLAVFAVVATVIIALLLRTPDEPKSDELIATEIVATAPPEAAAVAEPEVAPEPAPEKPETTAPEPEPEAKAPAPTKAKSKEPADPTKPTATRARMQYKRGNTYLKRGQVNAAIASYERALELDPTFLEPNGPLGVAYKRAGKKAEAEAAFDIYLGELPEEKRARAKRKLMRKFWKK